MDHSLHHLQDKAHSWPRGNSEHHPTKPLASNGLLSVLSPDIATLVHGSQTLGFYYDLFSSCPLCLQYFFFLLTLAQLMPSGYSEVTGRSVTNTSQKQFKEGMIYVGS